MAHYVCTGGCQGSSDDRGVCNIQSCLRHKEPLAVCNCTDGMHKEAYEAAHPESQEQPQAKEE